MLQYAIHQYVPQRRLKRASFETIDLDRMILAFKDGQKFFTDWAVKEVANILKNSTLKLSELVLMCCPASCQRTQIRRYKRFSKQLCEEVGMINGFDYVKVEGKRNKKHIQGHHSDLDYQWIIDTKAIEGKTILLFDDIVTTGKSSKTFAERLTSCGAHVKMAIYLAKTKNYKNYYA